MNDTKKRVAIATEENMVSGHFGHCPSFTLVDIENGSVVKRTTVPNPGHKPGFLPVFLSEQGANVIIAGGMGVHAQELFLERNITPVLGVTGAVDDVVAAYIAGQLQGGESTCNHGKEGHVECDSHGTH